MVELTVTILSSFIHYISYFSLSHGLKTSVPERLISANSGLKFCCTILMYKFTFHALRRVTFCIIIYYCISE